MDSFFDKTVLEKVYRETAKCPSLFYGSTSLGILLWLWKNLSDDEFFRNSIQGLNYISSDISFEKGITGVGTVLNMLYLKKYGKQLSGILGEIDAKVYQTAAYCNDLNQQSLNGLVFYLCYRLKYENRMPDDLREILSHQLERLAVCLISDFMESVNTDYRFSMAHRPSVFVFALSAIIGCVQNKNAWVKKLKQLLPILLEIYPYSSGNRLLYWHALSSLKSCCGQNEEIAAHLDLLQHSVSMQSLFDCVEGNVTWGEGVCGIYHLSRRFPKLADTLKDLSFEAERFIKNSSEIQYFRNDNYLRNHIGLWNGVAGIELTGLLMKIDRFNYGCK